MDRVVPLVRCWTKSPGKREEEVEGNVGLGHRRHHGRGGRALSQQLSRKLQRQKWRRKKDGLQGHKG